MTLEKVRALKIENPVSGGINTDPYPVEVSPNADYMDTRGITFQDTSTSDSSVYIDRVPSIGALEFVDTVAGTVQLSQLQKSSAAVNAPSVTVSGVTTLAAGSLSAPSLTFTGDTTSGLYDDTVTNTQLAIAYTGVRVMGLGIVTGTYPQQFATLGASNATGGVRLLDNGYLNNSACLNVKSWDGTAYADLQAKTITGQAGSMGVINAVANSSVVGFRDGGSGNFMAGMMYVANGTVRMCPNTLVSPNTTGLLYGGFPVQTKSASYTLTSNDSASTIEVTASITLTLPQIATVGLGTLYRIYTKGAYSATVTPNATDTINLFGVTKAAAQSVVNTPVSGSSILLQAIDSTTWGVIDSSPNWTSNWFDSARWEYDDDFMGNTFTGLGYPWYAQVSSGTVKLDQASFAGHPGVLQLSTAASATGLAQLFMNTDQCSGGYGFEMEMLVYIPVLSTSSQRFTIAAGGHNSASASAPTNGVWFSYSDSVSSGVWVCNVGNGVAAATASTVTVAAATWYKLGIYLAQDGSSVSFYINGTLATTVSTGLPTASNFFGPNVQLAKSIGTTASLLYIDRVFLGLTLPAR